MARPLFRRTSQGLALSFILLAVTLLAALAVTLTWSLRSTANSTRVQQDRLLAHTLLNQAAALHAGFESMRAQGVRLDSISWDETPGTGLFHPQNPGARPAALPHNAHGGGGVWRYRAGNIPLMNAGSGGGEYLIFAADIFLGVCRALNYQLHGAPLSAWPPILGAGGTYAAFVATGTALDLSADPATDGRLAGCVQTTDGQYVFYQVIEAR